ncbi:MAG: tetratricopeptide repeat protein [Bacteroidota bacterium]
MTRRLLGLFLLSTASVATASVAAQTAPVPTDTLVARVEAAPSDPEARRLLAQRFLSASDPASALPHVAWLADERPTDVARLTRLVDVALWADAAEAAAAALERLVALVPDDTDRRIRLAELITWEGGADRAVELLAPIAEARPTDARVHKAYAFALHASGDDAAARAQYTYAVQLNPEDAALLLEAGAIERWTGDWELGTTRLRKALRMDLDGPQRTRARELIAGIVQQYAPTFSSGVTYVTDSNGLSRVSTPMRASLTLNPQWGMGAAVTWDRVATAADPSPIPSAVATSIAPFVTYTPRRGLRITTGLGFESAPGGDLRVRTDIAVERAWAGDRFALARLDVSSATATDGVTALDSGIRRTQIAATGYAEPVEWATVTGQLLAAHYDDNNLRLLASVGASATGVRLGVRPEADAFRAGVASALRYERTATVYPASVPYFTPDRLTTFTSGVEMQTAPTDDLRAEAALGTAWQMGPTVSAMSLYYRLAVGADAGRHTVSFGVGRTGSAVYSDDTVSLTYQLRLW